MGSVEHQLTVSSARSNISESYWLSELFWWRNFLRIKKMNLHYNILPLQGFYVLSHLFVNGNTQQHGWICYFYSTRYKETRGKLNFFKNLSRRRIELTDCGAHENQCQYIDVWRLCFACSHQNNVLNSLFDNLEGRGCHDGRKNNDCDWFQPCTPLKKSQAMKDSVNRN